MSYTKEDRQQAAAKETRDQFGHFVKTESAKPPTASPASSGASAKDPNEPLVSFSIQNPLKYLVRFLNKVRKENTITIKIPPLIAIPILLALVSVIPASFGFGRSVEKEKIAAIPTPTPIVIIKPTAIPAPIMVSKLGVIKATYQVQALLGFSPSITVAPTNIQSSSSAAPAEVLPTPTPVPARLVLVKGEDITFLIVPPEINLSSYLNRRVLITGLYDRMADTIKISKSSDIEILP